MGPSAVIPEPNKSPAVIYVAGLTDKNKVKILRLVDSAKGMEWDEITEYDHQYMFSGLIPLKKASDDSF